MDGQSDDYILLVPNLLSPYFAKDIKGADKNSKRLKLSLDFNCSITNYNRAYLFEFVNNILVIPFFSYI